MAKPVLDYDIVPELKELEVPKNTEGKTLADLYPDEAAAGAKFYLALKVTDTSVRGIIKNARPNSTLIARCKNITYSIDIDALKAYTEKQPELLDRDINEVVDKIEEDYAEQVEKKHVKKSKSKRQKGN